MFAWFGGGTTLGWDDHNHFILGQNGVAECILGICFFGDPSHGNAISHKAACTYLIDDRSTHIGFLPATFFLIA